METPQVDLPPILTCTGCSLGLLYHCHLEISLHGHPRTSFSFSPVLDSLFPESHTCFFLDWCPLDILFWNSRLKIISLRMLKEWIYCLGPSASVNKRSAILTPNLVAYDLGPLAPIGFRIFPFPLGSWNFIMVCLIHWLCGFFFHSFSYFVKTFNLQMYVLQFWGKSCITSSVISFPSLFSVVSFWNSY